MKKVRSDGKDLKIRTLDDRGQFPVNKRLTPQTFMSALTEDILAATSRETPVESKLEP